MKHLIYILAILSAATFTQAQTMSWVPARYIDSNICSDETSCENNMVCYKLQYTPAETGTLTSYTAGFIINCDDRVSAVKSNSSCMMVDRSTQIMGCGEYGKILLNCSGNTGNIEVEADQPIYIHQICVQLDGGRQSIVIDESDYVQLSTSISTGVNQAKTEYAEFKQFEIINNFTFCEKAEDHLTLHADLDSDGKAKLIWEPAKETPNGFYTILKSLDGGTYEEVKDVVSQLANQISVFKYNEIVDLEEYGEHTFKVVYNRNDGSTSTSNAASIYYKDVRFTMSVSPNPTANQIRLLVTSPENQVKMNVFSMNGKLVLSQSVATDLEQFIDLRSLAPGMYNVSIVSGADVLTEKLIIID